MTNNESIEMTSKPTENKPSQESVQIANQIINMANDLIEQGVSSQDIAAGLRHAAANFTAFDFFQSTAPTKDPNVPVEEFISQFEYYLSAHKPKEDQNRGIKQLIEQAKNEVMN